MLISRFEKGKHYETLARLWKHYGWLACPPEALPKIGLVAEEEDRFIAYLGMYMETGTIALIDWALRDPQADPAVSDHALKVLFNTLARVARNNRCHFIYSVTKNRPWGEKMLSYGMSRAETGADTYILALDGMETAFIGD